MPSRPASRRLDAAWRSLERQRARIARVPLRDLFAADPKRFARFSLGHDGIFLDYSKNRIDGKIVDALLALARAADVAGWRRRLFDGDLVNASEGRAALHTALRDRSSRSKEAAAARATLARMREFVANVRSGGRFAHVVHIGIGGSLLGPELACEALAPFDGTGIEARFLSNVDGADFARAVRGLDPARTLFVVVSKTFATEETLANARAARDWVAAKLGQSAVADRFAAVTANRVRAREFGIEESAIFDFWDWVGGRFSLWSAVGLPAALTLGMDKFEELLGGAHAMDEHFRAAPLGRNLPVLLALIGVWNASVLGYRARAVVPYDSRLARLPDYLQQLEMESNGKSVTREGRPVGRATSPVVFGAPGTDAQHAFFQLLHQGPRPVPVEFIAAAEPGPGPETQRPILLAHMLAQGEALMRGRTSAEARAAMKAEGLPPDDIRRLLPHRVFPGNRPSTTILIRRLDPFHLGLLLALHEHKTFVEGVLWGVNSFDQWGVELGKQLAGGAARLLKGGKTEGRDPSTAGLARKIRAWRGNGS
ncbi:MAG: glucose-6-phosphate isomerase [Rhodospirillales bacterium]|nr:glucose-6-phosphate isomerase [Rhodospirillales bacterium]